MKKRNPFLISLLCLAAFIVLSGCASKDTGRQDAAAALPDTSEAASTPAEDVSPAPETPADTEEAPEQTDTEEETAVSMTIWSDETGEEFTYTLTPEDASCVITVFDHAEKEELKSPLADLPTLCFRFGEDYLDAPMEFLDVFSGCLDGKPMLARLDEESCNLIREIVYRYASPDMPNEWPDTPSAGEE